MTDYAKAIQECLQALDSQGWLISGPIVGPGQIEARNGVHMWPDHTADVFGCHDREHFHARRLAPNGTVLSESKGDMLKVLTDCVNFLPPSHPDAPRTPIATGPVSNPEMM